MRDKHLYRGPFGYAWLVRKRDGSEVSSVSIPLWVQADIPLDVSARMAGWALFAWARLKGWDG